MATPFARRVATIAEQQHTRFSQINEADPALCRQIERWTRDIGFAFTSCTRVPWSAAFVSWCVMQAGATRDEFQFALAHSVFVHRAIQNALSGTGVFQGFDISQRPADVGDIIQHNRGGARRTFDFARRNRNYTSHSVIVLRVADGGSGRTALCVGGNEGDSVRTTNVMLNADGFIRQRPQNSFICIVKNLK